MEKINALDTEVFYWINQHHCTLADYVLYTFTHHWMWVLVLVAIFVWAVAKDKKMWWAVLLGIALCFLLADRISVLCFKDVFQRLRPCHALPDVRMIFGMGCGGQYGFVSSHAANSFALAIFLTLWCGKKMKIKAIPYIAFTWAILTSYSRPYLGKHYPGDIICGALLGLLLGCLVYLIVNYVFTKVSYNKVTAEHKL